MVGSAVTLPIKEDDVSCRWRETVVLPLSMQLKPCDTIRTMGEFWNDARFNISALLGTPTDEAGTPFHTEIKAIPS